MTRYNWNRLINLVLAVLVVGITFSGVVMKVVLPPGRGGRHLGGGRGQGWGRAMLEGGEPEGPLTLWGLGRHDWGEIHLWLATVMIVLVVVHIWLHWGWVKRAYFGSPCPPQDEVESSGSDEPCPADRSASE